jgi:hypothetical protein
MFTSWINNLFFINPLSSVLLLGVVTCSCYQTLIRPSVFPCMLIAPPITFQITNHSLFDFFSACYFFLFSLYVSYCTLFSEPSVRLYFTFRNQFPCQWNQQLQLCSHDLRFRPFSRAQDDTRFCNSLCLYLNFSQPILNMISHFLSPSSSLS